MGARKVSPLNVGPLLKQSRAFALDRITKAGGSGKLNELRMVHVRWRHVESNQMCRAVGATM
jgi:hypothetical protein